MFYTVADEIFPVKNVPKTKKRIQFIVYTQILDCTARQLAKNEDTRLYTGNNEGTCQSDTNPRDAKIKKIFRQEYGPIHA